MQAVNRGLAALNEALKSAEEISPLRVWQCLSVSCQLTTTHPGVRSHAASHTARVALASPNGAVFKSASFSLATWGPAAPMPAWHSHCIPAGVGAGGTGADGGNGEGGGPVGLLGGPRV
eukprot:COSAG01_NODE_5632_length_4129_cov_3.222829_2_plen_119_part_00